MPLNEFTSYQTDPARSPECLPKALLPALRANHAGETGAVAIYCGILAVSRDPGIREFALHHLDTERNHLEWMDQLLEPGQRSRLLYLWRIAGWITGALPALFGANAVFRTIDAVEHFVDIHYSEQIEWLQENGEHIALRRLLESCRDDEIAHRKDACSRLGAAGRVGKAWSLLVAAGSRAGVYIASRY